MKIYIYTVCLLSAIGMVDQHAFAQNNELKIADSLFARQNWKAAKQKYINYLRDTSVNSLEWNRLGYCNHNLGLYDEAVKDYNTALANKPSPVLTSTVLVRMARVYSLMDKIDEATQWLVKATATGYNSLPAIDTVSDFKNLRASSKFKDIRQQVYEMIYPCTKEPRNRDFDFWIGDWNVYPTGTQLLVGYSHVESMAGGCALLENWTSTQAQTGKSFNYYDQKAGKWEQDWIGSGGVADRQRYDHGEYKNGAMHFIYETINAKGEKQPGNFIFYNIDNNTVRQYQEVSGDGGKTFQVVYDFTYLRKKS